MSLRIRKSEETWDAIAESFDVTRRKPWKKCIDFIDEIKKPGMAADIACGNGRHLLPLARRCKHVIGLDVSRELLKIVKKKIKEEKIKNITLLHSDAVNLPLKNNSLDAVMFIAALHNIPGRTNRVQALKEVKRVLKNNGEAIISVWCLWQDRFKEVFLKKLQQQPLNDNFGNIELHWKQHKLNIPRFYHLYTKKEFMKDLEKSGLDIKKLDEVKIASDKNPDNYFAVVKKNHCLE